MSDARGHEATARALLALPSEWTVLDDVVWPGRKPAEIDHVVVGPGGVFVIVSSRTGRSAAGAATSAAAVLARGARLHRGLVHAVLCSDAAPPADLGAEVLTCTPDSIVSVLLERQRVLDRDELVSASASVTSEVRLERGPRRSLTGGGLGRRAGSTGRLALFLLLVAATVTMMPWAADRWEGARAGQPPPTPEVGEAVWLAGTTSRPPVELTPEAVGAGGRSYVVRLTVHNAGTSPFAMGALDVGLTLDNLRPASELGQTQAELARTQLQPGQERVVTYRFVVPADRAAQSFVVGLGAQRTERVHWQVP